MAINTLLLLGTHCPHCPKVLEALTELVKKGEISSLEIINLEQAPEQAQALGVRSVPWVRIAEFELPGLRNIEEYRLWIQRSGSIKGMADYLSELLDSGAIDQTQLLLKKNSMATEAVFHLLGDPETKINLRLGLSVLLENLAEQGELVNYLDKLKQLTQHDTATIRADACHYLGLTNADAAKPALQTCLNDDNEEVREIAADSLEIINQA